MGAGATSFVFEPHQDADGIEEICAGEADTKGCYRGAQAILVGPEPVRRERQGDQHDGIADGEQDIGYASRLECRRCVVVPTMSRQGVTDDEKRACDENDAAARDDRVLGALQAGNRRPKQQAGIEPEDQEYQPVQRIPVSRHGDQGWPSTTDRGPWRSAYGTCAFVRRCLWMRNISPDMSAFEEFRDEATHVEKYGNRDSHKQDDK